MGVTVASQKGSVGIAIVMRWLRELHSHGNQAQLGVVDFAMLRRDVTEPDIK